ncbi:hypothetical protein [Sphaerisporangium sp. TRM90804]|uniref:hypothetical protein n=1 Tax=Sphaerisporangium sp. TRM90804 TaxID=3031113 RepID=UPI00244A855F|nr:hypothetical protein [Sphaerisporangium sp. TRM90804]MDH2426909.1 hypothetical protein [Sphaerisporangium sp. TRM90804]
MSSTPATRHVTASDAPAGRQPPATVRTLLGVVIGLTAVLVVMLCAFALPSVNGGPRHMPLGLTGPQQAAQTLRTGLDDEAWDVTVYPGPRELQAAIRQREIVGGLALGADGITVYTAGAAGQQPTAAINALGAAMAAQRQSEVTVHDVVPFPADDPRGAGFTATALPLIIGGILPAVALLRLFPGHANVRRRLAGVILFALVAGAAVAAVLQYGFGSLHGTYWLTALGLSLGMAALSIPFLALESLLGIAGLGAGAAVMMLLGNPLSGLAGPHWLPAGWATLGQLLPPGASGSLVRAVSFFDGTGAGGPALTLTAWALAGLAALLLTARAPRTAPPAAAG